MSAQEPSERIAGPVLIYRPGGCADTVVALPALRLLAENYAELRRFLVTPQADAEAARAVLAGTDLIEDDILPWWPVGWRHPANMLAWRRRVRDLRPVALVYLAPVARDAPLGRELKALRLCGIPRIVGAPLDPALRRPQGPGQDGRWEHEAARLGRCLAGIGRLDLKDPHRWALDLSPEELTARDQILNPWEGHQGFVVVATQATRPDGDWGDDNWRGFLAMLSGRHPGLGLVFIGDSDQAPRTAALAPAWEGPVLDLCGQVPPRVAALLAAQAMAFAGTATGPLHLCAAAGARCLGLYDRRHPPGWWDPIGGSHQILHAKGAIDALDPMEAVDRICRLFTAPRLGGPAGPALGDA